MRTEDVLQRIQGEFVEMPGLCLTAAQAQRLWGLDQDFCDQLLAALVREQFLTQRRDGSFIRVDDSPRRSAPGSVPQRPNAIAQKHTRQRVTAA